MPGGDQLQLELKPSHGLGTAVRLVRIIPDEYSELMQSTPSTAMASVAMPIPSRLTAVGSQLSLAETLLLA